MRYHFFLHYGWFFQNPGKEAVRTFMHTTVHPLMNQFSLDLNGTHHKSGIQTAQLIFQEAQMNFHEIIL